MTDTPKLLPCPFCGEAPRMEAYAGDVGGVHIECLTPDCPASPISTGGSMTDPLVAWNAWNRRHDAAVSAARKEGMLEAARIADESTIDGNAGDAIRFALETTP